MDKFIREGSDRAPGAYGNRIPAQTMNRVQEFGSFRILKSFNLRRYAGVLSPKTRVSVVLLAVENALSSFLFLGLQSTAAHHISIAAAFVNTPGKINIADFCHSSLRRNPGAPGDPAQSCSPPKKKGGLPGVWEFEFSRKCPARPAGQQP